MRRSSTPGALHVRHPGRAQHRDLRRARPVRNHHAGAGHARGRRRVHGRCREPQRHESRHARHRAGGRRDARASGIAKRSSTASRCSLSPGGIRRDTGRQYQLHDVNQHAMLKPITKGTWLIERHADVIPTIHEAVRVATTASRPGVRRDSGQPAIADRGDAGPSTSPTLSRARTEARLHGSRVSAAAELLAQAQSPTIFVGWGAVDARRGRGARRKLGAPVSTTLQGIARSRRTIRCTRDSVSAAPRCPRSRRRSTRPTA